MDWGIQSVKPGAPYEYNIEARRLLEKNGEGGGRLYDWPIHMAEKTWVDVDAFAEAFTKALDLLREKYQGAPDAALLSGSLAEARRRAKAR